VGRSPWRPASHTCGYVNPHHPHCGTNDCRLHRFICTEKPLPHAIQSTPPVGAMLPPRRLTEAHPVKVLQRLLRRLEKRMGALQRVKLEGYQIVRSWRWSRATPPRSSSAPAHRIAHTPFRGEGGKISPSILHWLVRFGPCRAIGGLDGTLARFSAWGCRPRRVEEMCVELSRL
jgi:hypothetical protein